MWQYKFPIVFNHLQFAAMNCPVVDARGKRKVNRIGFKWFALRAIKSVERLQNPLRKEERRQRVLRRRQINPIYLQQTELYIVRLQTCDLSRDSESPPCNLDHWVHICMPRNISILTTRFNDQFDTSR